MAAAIISGCASVLVGVLALVGVIITNNKANRDMQHKLDTSQAVTDTKIEELTREVRLHNNFAEKIPVIQEQIRVVNHRINDLENFHKPN
ncbi:MAG: hypothetical protein IKK24_03475 [Clostridia bacterium]|nr:hypothetical protein [Clostridia bacterium]